jgi:hypothetical protein
VAGPVRLGRGREAVGAGKAPSAAAPRTAPAASPTPVPARALRTPTRPAAGLWAVLTPLVLALAAAIALLLPLLSR